MIDDEKWIPVYVGGFTSVSFYKFAKQIKFIFFAILNDMLCLQSGS